MPRGDMIQRRCDSYLLGACRLGRETGIKKYCNDTSNSNVAIPTSGLSFDLLLTLILDTALLFFLVNKYKILLHWAMSMLTKILYRRWRKEFGFCGYTPQWNTPNSLGRHLISNLPFFSVLVKQFWTLLSCDLCLPVCSPLELSFLLPHSHPHHGEQFSSASEFASSLPYWQHLRVQAKKMPSTGRNPPPQKRVCVLGLGWI